MTALDALVLCLAAAGLVVVGILWAIRLEDAARRRRQGREEPPKVVDIRRRRKDGAR